MRYSFSQYLDGSGYGGWKSIHARNWGDKVLHVLHVDKTLEENDLPEQPPSYGCVDPNNEYCSPAKKQARTPEENLIIPSSAVSKFFEN